ncbi:MAG: sulfotransferase [Bacteroidia bacterium]|nr:sulfotransferase [Bacteroidia bacterium]
MGRARSGTTLLRTLFDAHPNVIIPVESPFIVRLYHKYGHYRYWNKTTLLNFWDNLQKVLYFENWTIDRDKCRNDLLLCEGAIDYQTICKIVYSNYISYFPKKEVKIFGDKNPVYSLSIKTLYKLFPESKYIYLTRDYRDHILSMIRTGLYASDVLALAYRWRYSARSIFTLMKKHPESFYMVRYEDFVSDPNHYLSRMCNFIGIDFMPEVLEFHKNEAAVNLVPKDIRQKFFSNLFKPVDASRTGLWKKQMNDEDVRKADMMVGQWAERLGYTRKFNDFNMSDWLKVIPVKLSLDIYYSLGFLRKRLPRWMRSGKHTHKAKTPEE